MNTTYAITMINAENQQPYSNVQLPILPRMGDNIIIGPDNYSCLSITIQGDQIQIMKPKSQSIINPNAPQGPQEEQLIIPVIIFAKITTLQMEPTDSDSTIPS